MIGESVAAKDLFQPRMASGSFLDEHQVPQHDVPRQVLTGTPNEVLDDGIPLGLFTYLGFCT